MKFKDITGVILIAIVSCIAGGGVYVAHQFKKIEFEPDTFCPLSGATSATIILVDKTDALSANELKRVEEVVGEKRKSLPQGAKLVISLLEQDANTGAVSVRPVISLCNPGSEANPLYQNPKRVMARYNESFLAPLQNALRAVSSRGSAPSSPIAEAIGQTVDPEGLPSLKDGELVLISDLMEHTLQGSAYDGSFTLGTLHKIISQESAMRLRKFAVEILLLPRPELARRQTAAKETWFKYFKDVRGTDPIMLDP